MSETTWTKDTKLTKYPPLQKNIETEVLIIGGGITGVLAAYNLSREGKKVVLIEKQHIGSDATHMTTAFITQSIDTDSADLISIHGQQKASYIVNAHKLGIDHLNTVVETNKIACDFSRCSNYIYINTPEGFKDLTLEYEATRKIGVDARLSANVMPGFKNFGYIEIKNQAKFHPLKFISGLLEILDKNDVEIYENTEAVEIRNKETNAPTVMTSEGLEIKAEWVIVATYEPFEQPIGLFFKKGMYVSYILEASIPKGSIRVGTYEDMQNPYHYFRIDSQDEMNDRIIVGGEDHRADLPVNEQKNFIALETYLKTLLGDLPFKITSRWNGPIFEPSDGLALIGPHKNDRVLYAFGFSGNGMTYAAIASLVFKQIITGKPATKEFNLPELYATSRYVGAKSLLYKARDYAQELVQGALKNTFSHKSSSKNRKNSN